MAAVIGKPEEGVSDEGVETGEEGCVDGWAEGGWDDGVADGEDEEEEEGWD